MKEQDIVFSNEQVSADERLARIVLSPRDIDPVTQYPKESFITLRNAEGGISFLRFDYMGKDTFLHSGEERANLYNKNLKKIKYTFVGWMEGKVGEIVQIAPDTISLYIDNPSNRPEHVNIVFKKNGEIVKGIVTDAVILDIMDELYHHLKYRVLRTAK